ncbi:uncharacterized protein THITE_2014519, partial [Thermothielavioides terrestris NRRL 8126]
PGWARENNGPRVLGVTVTMTTLGFLFVLARIYCRFISVRKLAVDDYIVVLTTLMSIVSVVFVGVAVSYGAGRHIATIPPNDAHKAIFYTMVASPPSILAFTVPKIAVLILLVKVLCPSRRHRVFMWTIAVLVSLMSIGTMVMIWVQCQPVAVQWGEAKGTCWNPEVVFIFGLVHGVLSALFDFYLAMYPSIVLSSLHRVNWKKKLALSSALGFGYCASGVAAYKAHTLSHLLSLKDFTFAIDDVVLWTNIEGNLVLIGACIPCLYPLVKKLFGVTAL